MVAALHGRSDAMSELLAYGATIKVTDNVRRYLGDISWTKHSMFEYTQLLLQWYTGSNVGRGER